MIKSNKNNPVSKNIISNVNLKPISFKCVTKQLQFRSDVNNVNNTIPNMHL